MDQDRIIQIISIVAVSGAAVFIITLFCRLVAWLLRQLAASIRLVGFSIKQLFNAFSSTAPDGTDTAGSAGNVVEGKPHIFQATHFVYSCLFILGVVTSAKTLTEYVPTVVKFDTLFILPMAVFMVTNCVHQYLIYRDLLDAESPSSGFFRRYSGWWLGTTPESGVRLIAMVCLLTLAGEIPLEKLGVFSHFPPIGHDGASRTNLIVAVANCSLYSTFLLWNIVAYCRSASSSLINRVEREAARKELKQTSVSDGLALVLWCCIVASLSNYQHFALGVTFFTAVYAIDVLFFRSPRRKTDRIYCLFFAASLTAVFLVLDFSTWIHLISAVPESLKISTK